MNSDKQLIDALGGPTAVALKLGFKLPGGASRVANWRTRGIPPRVKLENPALFLSAAKIVIEHSKTLPKSAR